MQQPPSGLRWTPALKHNPLSQFRVVAFGSSVVLTKKKKENRNTKTNKERWRGEDEIRVKKFCLPEHSEDDKMLIRIYQGDGGQILDSIPVLGANRLLAASL